MKLNRYKIVEGDTLESVAKNYNIGIEEMLHYHNRNSDLTKQIYGDFIPFHITEIIVDPTLKNVEELKFDELTKNNPRKIEYNYPPNSCYKIAIFTSLYYLGKPVTENQIDSTWRINYDSEQNSVVVEVTDKNRIKVDGQIVPLLDILDKINKATDSLNLQLNTDKTIKNVINDKEILDQWEKIKFDDLKFYELEDEYFKLIIEAYNLEFNSLSKSLQKNILYQIFFYPQGNVVVPTAESKLIAGNQTVISQLFPQQFISYDLYSKSQEIDGMVEVICSSKVPNDWNTKNLEAEFKKNYATLIEDPFDFKFSLESKYNYDEQGILKIAKSYIKEQANEKLFYISEYKIMHLENDISNAVDLNRK